MSLWYLPVLFSKIILTNEHHFFLFWSGNETTRSKKLMLKAISVLLHYTVHTCWAITKLINLQVEEMELEHLVTDVTGEVKNKRSTLPETIPHSTTTVGVVGQSLTRVSVWVKNTWFSFIFSSQNVWLTCTGWLLAFPAISDVFQDSDWIADIRY